MVVKAAPSTPFMVTEPKFLLELRVVAPDAPPPPGLPDPTSAPLRIRCAKNRRILPFF
jgi:hypothetical protein